MLSFMARVIGLFLLVLALITAVMDITRSIGASKMVLTPLGEAWSKIGEASLGAAQVSVETYIHPLVWDPVIVWVLLWPSWLIFAILAFVFMALGRRRRRKLGRFTKN
jgi:hypothetical protein